MNDLWCAAVRFACTWITLHEESPAKRIVGPIVLGKAA
jgi:hypothetical protein